MVSNTCNNNDNHNIITIGHLNNHREFLVVQAFSVKSVSMYHIAHLIQSTPNKSPLVQNFVVLLNAY